MFLESFAFRRKSNGIPGLYQGPALSRAEKDGKPRTASHKRSAQDDVFAASWRRRKPASFRISIAKQVSAYGRESWVGFEGRPSPAEPALSLSNGDG
jgi:hypothetical protein